MQAYSVSQKNLFFSDVFFPKPLGIFSLNFIRLLCSYLRWTTNFYSIICQWRSHGWARVGTCPPYLGQGGS